MTDPNDWRRERVYLKNGRLGTPVESAARLPQRGTVVVYYALTLRCGHVVPRHRSQRADGAPPVAIACDACESAGDDGGY